MLEISAIIGAPLFIAGCVMLIAKPGYWGAATMAIGLAVLSWSLTLAAIAFSLAGGLVLLFGNPYRRRTSISTGRPEGERTGSSPSKTP